MSRRLAREAAIRTLFQIDASHAQVEQALTYNISELGVSEKNVPFAQQLVEGALKHRDEIDQTISRHSDHWSIERMARTDRSILRMAVYEILFIHDIPGSVSVNEAVELAKEYGDADSGKFVNGVLGQILRNLPAPKET